jgi:hypothetical protein
MPNLYVVKDAASGKAIASAAESDGRYLVHAFVKPVSVKYAVSEARRVGPPPAYGFEQWVTLSADELAEKAVAFNEGNAVDIEHACVF